LAPLAGPPIRKPVALPTPLPTMPLPEALPPSLSPASMRAAASSPRQVPIPVPVQVVEVKAPPLKVTFVAMERVTFAAVSTRTMLLAGHTAMTVTVPVKSALVKVSPTRMFAMLLTLVSFLSPAAYCAVRVPSDSAAPLHSDSARSSVAVPPEAEKFDTVQRPLAVTPPVVVPFLFMPETQVM
jgi:hypothetical protein